MKRNMFFSGIVMVLAAMALTGCSICGVDGDEEGVVCHVWYFCINPLSKENAESKLGK